MIEQGPDDKTEILHLLFCTSNYSILKRQRISSTAGTESVRESQPMKPCHRKRPRLVVVLLVGDRSGPAINLVIQLDHIEYELPKLP